MPLADIPKVEEDNTVHLMIDDSINYFVILASLTILRSSADPQIEITRHSLTSHRRSFRSAERSVSAPQIRRIIGSHSCSLSCR
jgi:hypothetical protein